MPALHGVPRVGRRQLLSLLLRVSGEKIGAFRLKLGRDDPYSVHMVICTLNMGYKASRIIKFANWLEIRRDLIAEVISSLFPQLFSFLRIDSLNSRLYYILQSVLCHCLVT